MNVERFLRIFSEALGVDHREFLEHVQGHANMELARQQERMSPMADEDARVFIDIMLQQMYPNVRSFNQ